MQDFLRENQNEIDAAITNAQRFTPRQASCQCSLSGVRDHYCGSYPRINDEERRQWVLNNEGLYRWARSEGVRI
jgi:hypothetical protein